VVPDVNFELSEQEHDLVTACEIVAAGKSRLTRNERGMRSAAR